jgi:hypothetical protein
MPENPETPETPAKRPKKNATSAEVSLRVEEVLRIRLDGAQFHDVVQYASEKGWGVSDRQIGNYIRRADDLLVERQDKGRRRILARHFAQRSALYARAINAADYRTALTVLQDEAKLRGLYPIAPKGDANQSAAADLMGELLRGAIGDRIRDRGAVGGEAGQPGGAGGGGPAADVEDTGPSGPD